MKAKDKKKHKVFLIYEERRTGGGVRSGDEDSEWPNYEDAYYDFIAKALRLTAPEWSQTIEVDFDPQDFDHLYVLIIRYQSGSTFGISHGNWYIEGAYKTYEEAEKIMVSIKQNKYRGYTPWVGYFERLEHVSIERLDIWKD